MLHDTLGSGVVSYDAANSRLQLIPANTVPGAAQPIVTAVYFEAFDSAGGTTTSSTAITVPLGTTRHNSHPNIFSLASNELEIKQAGVYEFEYTFTCTTTGGTRASHRGFVEQQIVSGPFSTINGTQTYQYTRTSDTTNSATKRFIQSVGAGRKYRLRVVQTAATVSNVTMLATASSLLVRKIA
jgi:hypothetical protein